MADSLNTNPIEVDLTNGNARLLRASRVKVTRIVLNGPTPGGGTTNISLRTNSGAGQVLWSFNDSGPAAQVHSADEIDVWADNGLYFANTGIGAWPAGSRLLVYVS